MGGPSIRCGLIELDGYKVQNLSGFPFHGDSLILPFHVAGRRSDSRRNIPQGLDGPSLIRLMGRHVAGCGLGAA